MLHWELGSDTSPETKRFNLVHRRPQIRVEMSMSNLTISSTSQNIYGGTDLFGDPDQFKQTHMSRSEVGEMYPYSTFCICRCQLL
jgi:hypothetical protein